MHPTKPLQNPITPASPYTTASKLDIPRHKIPQNSRNTLINKKLLKNLMRPTALVNAPEILKLRNDELGLGIRDSSQ